MKSIKFYNLSEINKKYEKTFFNSFKKINKRSQYIIGKEVKKFEKKFSRFCNSKYCLGVGNGFDALKLAFLSYKILGIIQDGDEVLVPANTYIASILAVTEVNLKPIFIEPDESTFNISVKNILAKINKKTKAILAVDLYGLPAELTKIKQIAKKYNLKVVEDAAQAHGAKIKEKRIGSISDITCFSFFPGKNIGALGDAGAITTNNLKVYNVIRSLRSYGEKNYINFKDRKYENFYKGVNSRLDEIQATILNMKLRDYPNVLKKRKMIAQYYLKKIKNPLIELPFPEKGFQSAWHLFVIKSHNRNKLRNYLKKNKIQTIIHYPIPPHKQLAFKEFNKLELKVTEKLSNSILSIPNFPTLKLKQLNYIVKVINNFR